MTCEVGNVFAYTQVDLPSGSIDVVYKYNLSLTPNYEFCPCLQVSNKKGHPDFMSGLSIVYIERAKSSLALIITDRLLFRGLNIALFVFECQ
jgi:hypothetical protein